ncbi:MAG: hypothetical protein ACRD0P_09200 [Stackebrandtia sp.]
MDAEAARLPLPEPLTPPPLSRAWWRRFETPYMTLSLVAVAFAVVLAARRPWGIDFWVHATAVDRLSRDLLDPGGLQITGATAESSYYSPYTVVVAMLSQVSGASAVTALSWMAPPAVALLCFGFYRFVRLFSAELWFPVFALAVAVTLWGWDMWTWSGFLSVNSLPVILPLPSVVASALMFLVWTMFARAIAEPRAWRWTGMASLATLIVLTHQITALNTAIGCLAIAVWRFPKLDSRVLPGLLTCLGVSIALVISWPYYSVVALLGSGAVDGSHQVLYSQPWLHFGFAVLGLPALWLRWRRDRRDVLVWMAVLGLMAVAAGWVTGHYTYARVLPVPMVAIPLALVLEIYRNRCNILGTRLWTAATALTCSLALAVNSGNLLYVLPPTPALADVQFHLNRNPVPTDYSWLRDVTSRGDVVMTDDLQARRIITAYGLFTVAPGWQDPVVPDTDNRGAAVERFFTDSDVRDRAAIAREYGVDWILDVPGGVEYAAGDAEPPASGPEGQRLYRVSG